MRNQIAAYSQYALVNLSDKIAKVSCRFRTSSYWQDIVWQAAGNSFAQVIGIIGIPIFTRVYSPSDFALQNIFLQIVGIGIGIMTWRYEYFIQLPKEDADSKYLMQLVLLLGVSALVILTPICWLYRQPLATFLGENSLAPWLALIPITSSLSCFSIALQHNVQRGRNYRKSGLSEIVNKGAYISSGITGKLLFADATGLITANALGYLGKIISLVVYRNTFDLVGALYNFNLKNIKKVAKEYYRLSISMVFSHLMMTCSTAIPAIFIARHYDKNTLGQFALVMSTLYLPTGLIGAAIGQVYYQRAAQSWAEDKSFTSLWRSTAKKLLLIGVPIYAVTALLSPRAYPLIFGAQWKDAGNYAAIMSISALFSFISTPLDRSSLIVGAWWYLPGWHAGRVATILGITLMTERYNWSFNIYLILVVIQTSFMYLIDYWTEWHFSGYQPRKE